MTTALTSRLVRTVLIAGLALPVMTLLSPVETFTTAKAATTTMAGPQSEAATLAEFKTILAQYGTFTFHQTYGEVWVPTVTPQGWHPYPACQWVHTKDVGWYFNDDTAWAPSSTTTAAGRITNRSAGFGYRTRIGARAG
jgi:hypothetical protein